MKVSLRITLENIRKYAKKKARNVNLLMPLVGIGMETASGRNYIEKEKIDYASYISTAVSLTVILSLVIYFILIFLEPFLSNYITITRDWFIAWICVAWAQTISGLVLVIQQMSHKPLGFGLWRIGRSFIINGLLIIFILVHIQIIIYIYFKYVI